MRPLNYLCLYFALGLTMLLSSCAKVELTGPYLTLPRSCYVGRNASALQKTGGAPALSFQKFDQAYPPEWPSGLTLPAETYIAHDGQIKLTSAEPDASGRYLHSYRIEGVWQGDAKELEALLVSSANVAGYQTGGAKRPAGPDPQTHVDWPAALIVQINSGPQSMDKHLELTIYSEPIDGYIYFAGQFSAGE